MADIAHRTSHIAHVRQRPNLFWRTLHLFCFLYFVPMYRFRAWGVRKVPLSGPVLLVCNHQSFLDPIIVGLPMSRRSFHALARKTLWNNKFIGWIITGLQAFPVDQENPGDLRAMRACLELLNAGDALLIFAEGARTLTGKTEPFQTGTMLLIKRAKPTVVPMAIEGAYAAWPRVAKRPKLTGRIGVTFGDPMPAEELLTLKPDQALSMLRDKVEALRLQTAERLAR